MKKMKLFPKTFLYVFSLMAAIAGISHALFFFFMPVVYTGQKEDAFKAVEKELIEALEGVSCNSFGEIENLVRKYALQNNMGIFVSCAGHTYNFSYFAH